MRMRGIVIKDSVRGVLNVICVVLNEIPELYITNKVLRLESVVYCSAGEFKSKFGVVR